MRGTVTSTASPRQARPTAGRTGHVLLGIATLMSLVHHADHVARGDHTGWPVIDQVTPFTYSLAVYPLIGVGLWLERSRRVGSRFWTLFSGAGVIFLLSVHVGPAAIEPPHDIVHGYAAPWLGMAAFGWLLALILVVSLHCLHHARVWRHTPRR